MTTLQDLAPALLDQILACLSISERLHAELVCRQWHSVLRSPGKLEDLDLSRDPAWRHQVSRRLLEQLIARSSKVVPDTAVEAATANGQVRGAEAVPGATARQPAGMPAMTLISLTSEEVHSEADMLSTESDAVGGRSSSLLRRLVLRDCLCSWHASKPSLQAPASSELPSALVELAIGSCPQLEVIDARGFGLKGGCTSLGGVLSLRQAMAARPSHNIRALHVDLWCWSLGDAWDAYRGRWLGFTQAASPEHLWSSVLSLLDSASLIRVHRLIFQGRHASWQARLDPADVSSLLQLRLVQLNDALHGNADLKRIEIRPATEAEAASLATAAAGVVLEPRIHIDLQGPVLEHGPEDRALAAAASTAPA